MRKYINTRNILIGLGGLLTTCFVCTGLLFLIPTPEEDETAVDESEILVQQLTIKKKPKKQPKKSYQQNTATH